MLADMKAIALDIGGTRIKMAVVQNGVVLRSKAIPAFSEGALQERLPAIENALTDLTNGAFSEYCGLGIAMPCLVDARNHRATEIYGKFEDAPELDLPQWAWERFHLPIVMEQDSKAALIGEVMYGAARGYENVLLLIMGTGVGTAVMLNGRLLDGQHHFAGSLGSHIQIEVNGRKCTCGNIGCLEAYTSGWALPALIREHEGFAHSVLHQCATLDFASLEAAARQGDRVGRDVLQTIVCAMRAGIISLIHAYDPAAVVLSGGPLKMGDIFTAPLLEGVADQVWGKGESVRFLIAERPDESVVLGLHYLMTQHAVKKFVDGGDEMYAL